jgi:hypothetical protein
VVVAVVLPAHQSGSFGAVDETDRAVVTEEQVFGDVTDRRAARVGVAPDRQQELVLDR